MWTHRAGEAGPACDGSRPSTCCTTTDQGLRPGSTEVVHYSNCWELRKRQAFLKDQTTPHVSVFFSHVISHSLSGPTSGLKPNRPHPLLLSPSGTTPSAGHSSHSTVSEHPDSCPLVCHYYRGRTLGTRHGRNTTHKKYVT